MSSRFSTMRFRRAAAWSISWLKAWRTTRSVPMLGSSRLEAAPVIAVSGVRSSWETEFSNVL